MVKTMMILLVAAVTACGYGYWDVFGMGGRVESLTPLSAGTCGSAVPDGSSALSLFTNPSALAGSDKMLVSLSGWGTGWREEISYHYICKASYLYNIGAMSPKGSFAVAVPVRGGFSLGAGVATVSQYQMKASVQVHKKDDSMNQELFKTMQTDATGDLNEVLVSFAGAVGPVRLGVSSGSRFGSGGSTTYANRVNGADSTFVEYWEHAEFAFRAGSSVEIGYTTVYSTYVNGDSRYLSSASLGAVAAFPFMKGGYLGTEVSVRDGDNLKTSAFASQPGVVPSSNMFLGVCGYRQAGGLKADMGLSIGGDYSFDRYRVTAAYQYQGHYRNGADVPVSYINHVYDVSETVMIGIETSF